MKKFLTRALVPALILVSGLCFYFLTSNDKALASNYISKIYTDQGGDRFNVLTGGGVLDMSGAMYLGGTQLTSTGAELNILNGVTASSAELNILDGVTSTTAEVETLAAASQLVNGLIPKKLVRGSFDCAATTATCDASATIDIGANLPANSIITQTYVMINTAFPTSASIDIGCAAGNEAVNGVEVDTHVSGAILAGTPVGTATTMALVSNAVCDLQAIIQTGASSAGIVNVFIEYVVPELLW